MTFIPRKEFFDKVFGFISQRLAGALSRDRLAHKYTSQNEWE
jgi:hypothetical protein